jgi:hypothetical protein
VPEHGVRCVRFLQARDFLVTERQLLGGEGILDLAGLGSADDRGRWVALS